MCSGSRPSASRKVMPATNAAMKPDPPSAAGCAVGERRAGARDHLPPRARDQVSAAGVDDDRRDHEPAYDPADNPVADLLEQQRRGAAALRDLRFHVGHRHGREQQRHADPVVEPALDVEPLADPAGDARLGDDRLPQRGVGRRQHDRQDHCLLDAQPVEDDGRRDGAERDRQRQSDPEQAHRHPDLAAKQPEIDARGVAEQHQRQRRLRQRSHGPARALEIDLAEHLGPHQQPHRDEDHRRRNGVPDSRPEIAATASSVQATMARAHSTGPRWPTMDAPASSRRGDCGPYVVTGGRRHRPEREHQIYGVPNDTVLEMIEEFDPRVPLTIKPLPLAGFTRSAAGGAQRAA